MGLEGTKRPRQRANAAIHFISNESVRDIADASGSHPDARRYKPNIVLRGVEVHQELELIGRYDTVHDKDSDPSPESNPMFRIDRGTPRCPVPSLDPETGETLGDVKLSKMPKAENSDGKQVRSAGVYGHLANGAHAFIHRGQKVTSLR